MGSHSAERKLIPSLKRMGAYSLEFIPRGEFFSAPLAREHTLSAKGLILRSKVVHKRLDPLGMNISSSMFNTVVLIISPTPLSRMGDSPALRSRRCQRIEHSDCRIATKSGERPCATTSAHTLEVRTYLIELIVIFECRTAYVAESFHRLFLEDRYSELVLHRRHVGTMLSHHVLDV